MSEIQRISEPAVLQCKRCKEDLPMDREFFYRDKNGPHGWRRICKGCYSETPCIVRRTEQRAHGEISA